MRRFLALAALAGVAWPVLQSSANRSGGPDARRVEDVDQPIRSGVDLILDGGELPGTPSTVVVTPVGSATGRLATRDIILVLILGSRR